MKIYVTVYYFRYTEQLLVCTRSISGMKGCVNVATQDYHITTLADFVVPSGHFVGYAITQYNE